MPSTSLSVDHSLTQAEALERLQEFIPQLRERFGGQVSNLQESWEEHLLSFSFKTMGFDVSGKMAVHEEAVHFDGKLPFAALMFRGKIEQSVREELNRLLS
jgi:hypothetical protein